MKNIIIIALIALTASACTDTNLEDGVPKITDPDNIIVDGQPMTAEAFYNAYCKLKPTHNTCIAVQQTAERKLVLKNLQNRTVPRF